MPANICSEQITGMMKVMDTLTNAFRCSLGSEYAYSDEYELWENHIRRLEINDRNMILHGLDETWFEVFRAEVLEDYTVIDEAIVEAVRYIYMTGVMRDQHGLWAFPIIGKQAVLIHFMKEGR